MLIRLLSVTARSRLGGPAAQPTDRSAAWVPVGPRGSLLLTAVSTALGGTLTYLLGLPAVWRLSWPYGLLLSGLAVTELGGVGAALVRPTRRRLWSAIAAASAVVVLWGLTEATSSLPGPDPWTPVNAAIGFTGALCAGLHLIAAAAFAVVAVRGSRPRRSWWRRAAGAVAVAPLMVIVLLGSVIGIAAGSDGFAGSGVPAAVVAPENLPSGQRSTVEYCRPNGVPLAMDLYPPPVARRVRGLAPVAMYVHGGGLVLGDRRLAGLGAQLADHDGALFTPLRQRLNARRFVVASIDYRLTPGASWRAPIEDAKCAVRFLRAHAAGLGIDAARIGVWGSSAGGQLASLLGLAGPAAGFDRGQYTGMSSAVQAVVDMFGPGDMADLGDSSGFARAVAWVSLGGSIRVRHAISPVSYVARGAPPFLILHGVNDDTIPLRQSLELAARLHAAAVPTTLVEVAGAGHTLATRGEQPSAARLADLVTDFLTRTLGSAPGPGGIGSAGPPIRSR